MPSKRWCLYFFFLWWEADAAAGGLGVHGRRRRGGAAGPQQREVLEAQAQVARRLEGAARLRLEAQDLLELLIMFLHYTSNSNKKENFVVPRFYS